MFCLSEFERKVPQGMDCSSFWCRVHFGYPSHAHERNQHSDGTDQRNYTPNRCERDKRDQPSENEHEQNQVRCGTPQARPLPS